MLEPLTILLAGLAAWVAGAIWYGLLGNKWVAALGTTKQALAREGVAKWAPFLVALGADVLMAWVLALVLAGTVSTGVPDAVAWAMVLWMGFILATTATNYGFARRSSQLTFIDAGHWLFALLAAAVVLGLLG